VRAYDGRPLPEESKRRILEAGRLAGSSRNRQQRRFVVLSDHEAAASAVFNPANVRGAALVVAIVVGGKGPLALDAGRAAQNMMLAAWAEEISSCPVSLHRQECAVETLGLPADARVPIAVGFGYRAKPPKHVPEGARLGWDEYVYTDRFEPRT
jgi:nitroreductase